MVKNSSTGFWLSAIPGLVGLFGLGELYMGRRLRAEGFLAYTAVLYVITLLALVSPDFASPYTGYLPIIWGTGYLLLLIDIFRLTRRKKEVAYV